MSLHNRIDDRRAWTAATIDTSDRWTTTLSESALSELESVAGDTALHDATSLRITATDLPHCAEQLADVGDELETGRGFVLLERLDEDRFGRAGATTAYWALGQLLGTPCTQNVEGDLLYDVRDSGRSVEGGARFSVTNAESTFHTDNAFNDDLPDLVGLLCLRTATQGGRSQLVSACALYNELLDAGLTTDDLHKSYWFDRRRQEGPGERPIAARQLFVRNETELVMRYMAYYIEVGQQRAEEALSPSQQSVLDTIESILSRPDMRIEFDLHRGQMMFTNNRWILHNRTAFTDRPDPDDRRHYVRLWLNRA